MTLSLVMMSGMKAKDNADNSINQNNRAAGLNPTAFSNVIIHILAVQILYKTRIVF